MPNPSSASTLPALAALSWATALYALFFNVQPLLVAALESTFGWSTTTLGQIMSAGLAAAFLVLASSFFWAHRVRRRRAVALGLVVALLGLAANLTASTLTAVVLGIVLFGGGLAITAAPVVQALGAMANATRAFAVAQTVMVLVAAACAWAIPALVLPAWGYPGVVLLLMAIVALGLPALAWLPEAEPAPASAGATATSPVVWLALAASALYMLGLNSNWALIGLVGLAVPLDLTAIGSAVSVALTLGALGSVLAAVLGNRPSATAVLLVASAGYLAYGLTMAGSSGLWGFGSAVLLFTLIWNFSLPYTMDMVGRLDRDGRLLALVPASQALGATIGPLAGGPALLHAGPSALFALLVACTLLVAWLYRGLERRPAAG